MKKYLLILFGTLACCAAEAQVVVSPLMFDPVRAAEKGQADLMLRRGPGDTLDLPFFDDFSRTTGLPDAAFWLQTGNVYVNNRFGREPVTVGVATFDGVKASGAPYLVTATTPQPTLNDTLTSKPLRLGNYTAGHEISLHFFWQAGGMANNAPDNTSNHFLELQFKNRNGNWVQVWKQQGLKAFTPFRHMAVPVTGNDYLYDGFQFRFRNSGRPTGMIDIWNIDYVHLNTKAGHNDPNLQKDAGFSVALNSFLSPYTSMPIHQFLQDQAGSITDSIRTTINNVDTLNPTVLSYEGSILNRSKGFRDDFASNSSVVFNPGEKQKPASGMPNKTTMAVSADFQTVEEIFSINNRETNAFTRYNDTIRSTTELHDYYAYDDGTAEGGFSVIPAGTSNVSQIAQRFHLNQPDEVTAFRIYFTQHATNLSGRSLTFRVWDEVNGQPAPTPKYQQSFQLQYTDSLNKFYEVVLNNPVQVTDRFYAGISLVSLSGQGQNFINLGIDLNAPVTGQIYTNSGAGWLQYNERGALMLRPVMSNRRVTALAEDKAAAAVAVYPNPGSGLFQIRGSFTSYTVTDMTGRVVLAAANASDAAQLDLRHLPSGLYLLQLQTSHGPLTRKIILTR